MTCSERMQYGYRTDEFQAYDRLSRLTKIRLSDVSIHFKNPHKKMKFHSEFRSPVAASLPLWLEGVTGLKADDSDIASIVDGIKHRVGGITPSVRTKTLKEFKVFVKAMLENLFQPLDSHTDVTFETYLEHVDLPEARKEQLRTANESLKDTMREIRDLKSFIKEEHYWEPKAFRTINSRSDEYKTLVGPWIHAVEKEVFKMPWFIKTVPVADRAQTVLSALDKAGRVFMSTDFTAYESSFRKEVMDACEFQFFEHMTKNIPDAASFLEHYKEIALNNKLKFDSLVATIVAKRMSGEMSTSIANGFTNLMLILFTAFKQGIPFDQIDLFVEGDDSIISCVRKLTTYYFEALGFSVKMEVHSDIRNASFCGLIFSEPGHIIRDPRPVLAKFGWAMRRYVNAGYDTKLALLRSKAISLACEYPNCPVLAPFAHRVMELTKLAKFSKMKKIAENADNYTRRSMLNNIVSKPWQKKPDILPATRVLMEKLYGIDVELQYIWEDVLSNVGFGPFTLPGMETFFDRDWTQNWEQYVRDYNHNFPAIKRNMRRPDANTSYLPDNPVSDCRKADLGRVVSPPGLRHSPRMPRPCA